MAKRTDNLQRLRRLRAARTKIKRLAKPAFQKRLAADLKRFDKETKLLRRRVADGKIAKGRAKHTLGLLTKARRETARFMSSSRTTIEQALTTIDRDIERIHREG